VNALIPTTPDDRDQESEHDAMLVEFMALVAGESAPSLR
jgi:hypothetical protein